MTASNRLSTPAGEEPNVIEVLKVSSRSSPNAVAGALAAVLRSVDAVEIQVVGAGALNQAVKAIAIARGYLAEPGMDVVCRPTFAGVTINGEARTAIRLLVERRADLTTFEAQDIVPAPPTLCQLP